MANALIAGYAETVSVARTAMGSYVSGVWTSGALTTLSVKAVVLPVEPTEMAELELGQHVKGAIRLYTETELKTVSETDKTHADVVTWQGHDYEVNAVSYRSQIAGLEHYSVLAVRVEGT